MRFLIFFNLIAIIVIGAALARMYQGTPLPWQLGHSATLVAPADKPLSEDHPAPATALRNLAIPEEKPERAAQKAVESSTTTPDAPVLRFLTEGSYPPFNERNSKGKLVGYDIDTANAICKYLHRRCEIDSRSWENLLPALQQNQADAVIASMLIASPAISDNDQIAFSNPYYKTPGHFAARRDGASLKALNSATIVVQADSTHEAFLKAHFPDAKRLAVKTLEEAEKILADRRADLLFADRNALLIWLKNKGQGACCRLVGGDYSNPKYFGGGAGIAVRAGDKPLLAQINKALAEMARDGTQADIARSYFGQNIR